MSLPCRGQVLVIVRGVGLLYQAGRADIGHNRGSLYWGGRCGGGEETICSRSRTLIDPELGLQFPTIDDMIILPEALGNPIDRVACPIGQILPSENVFTILVAQFTIKPSSNLAAEDCFVGIEPEVTVFVDCGAREKACAEGKETVFGKATGGGKLGVGGPTRFGSRVQAEDEGKGGARGWGWGCSHCIDLLYGL